MRKIKEVLRLRFGSGLQQDQIARSCSIGQATVHRYLEKAAAAKVTWPLPDDFNDRQLDELLFPKRPLRIPSQPRPGLDFAQLHSQLQTHKHLTLQLLWEEYRETHPDGYGYSRFCELYQRWNRSRDVVLRPEPYAVALHVRICAGAVPTATARSPVLQLANIDVEGVYYLQHALDESEIASSKIGELSLQRITLAKLHISIHQQASDIQLLFFRLIPHWKRNLRVRLIMYWTILPHASVKLITL